MIEPLENIDFASGVLDGLLNGTNWPKAARTKLKTLMRLWLKAEMVARLQKDGSL